MWHIYAVVGRQYCYKVVMVLIYVCYVMVKTPPNMVRHLYHCRVRLLWVPSVHNFLLCHTSLQATPRLQLMRWWPLVVHPTSTTSTLTRLRTAAYIVTHLWPTLVLQQHIRPHPQLLESWRVLWRTVNKCYWSSWPPLAVLWWPVHQQRQVYSTAGLSVH